MKYVIVLFNLRDGVSEADYEAWARSTDLPTVRGLSSVDSFNVFSVTGTFSGAPAPYRYCEVIAVSDMAAFGVETKTEAMKKISHAFQKELADAPLFMLADRLD